MKPSIRRNLLLTIPLAVTALTASCVSYPYEGSAYSRPSGSGYVTYRSLPSGYSGDAYYYNNRYYAGGRYEPGTYTYRGRTYNHRYIHNGQYLYGGEYRPQAGLNSYGNSDVRASISSRYVTYRTLPANYSGDAYYYNDRYYAGGRYEPGTFSYGGRTYDHRYIHDGQYLYGGDYRRSAAEFYDDSMSRHSTPAYRTTARRTFY